MNETEGVQEIAGTLGSGGRTAGSATTQDAYARLLIPIAFDETQITSAENRSQPRAGDPSHPLAAGARPPTVAFHARQDPDVSREVTHPLDTDAHSVAIGVSLRGRDGGGTAELTHGAAPALRASQGGGDKPHVLASMTVRRITPKEACRLQGFPDDYLDIIYRKKVAADGPKYRALGNSMAVPVMVWIGQKIEDAVV